MTLPTKEALRDILAGKGVLQTSNDRATDGEKHHFESTTFLFLSLGHNEL